MLFLTRPNSFVSFTCSQICLFRSLD